MKKPEPTENHLRLRELAGEWKGEEVLHETKVTPRGKAKGFFSFRPGVDGFFLIADYTQETEGKISLRGHGVIGWDASQSCYTLHWFDSYGLPPDRPGRGQWRGDTLAFEHEYSTKVGRTVFQLGGPGLVFKVEMNFENQGWQTALEGTYRRA